MYNDLDEPCVLPTIYDSLFDTHSEFINFFKTPGKDTEENRNAILKTSKLCYWYCRFIKDRPEVRKGITASSSAYWYCKVMGDDDEVAGRIVKEPWVESYLLWAQHMEAQEIWRRHMLSYETGDGNV